jgi:hypothetical protein
MGTVLRWGPYTIVIHTRDHLPPHVHVLRGGDEHEVVIGLAPVEVREVRSMDLRHVTEAVRLVERHAAFLLEKWSEIHG